MEGPSPLNARPQPIHLQVPHRLHRREPRRHVTLEKVQVQLADCPPPGVVVGVAPAPRRLPALVAADRRGPWRRPGPAVEGGGATHRRWVLALGSWGRPVPPDHLRPPGVDGHRAQPREPRGHHCHGPQTRVGGRAGRPSPPTGSPRSGGGRRPSLVERAPRRSADQISVPEGPPGRPPTSRPTEKPDGPKDNVRVEFLLVKAETVEFDK